MATPIDVVDRGIFFPRTHPVPRDLPARVHPLEIHVNAGITLGGFAFLARDDLPTVLLFHGNGEVAWEYLDLAGTFLALGANLAAVDYRGYGTSTGTPSFRTLQADAWPCFHQVRALLFESGFPGDLVVMGRSLGSACAAEIGSRRPAGLAGIIFESGFCNTRALVERLLGINDLAPGDVTPYANDWRVREISAPVLVIHGSRDGIIPPGEADALHDALPAATWKRKVIIEGAGHNDIMMHADVYFDAIKAFIDHVSTG